MRYQQICDCCGSAWVCYLSIHVASSTAKTAAHGRWCSSSTCSQLDVACCASPSRSPKPETGTRTQRLSEKREWQSTSSYLCPESSTCQVRGVSPQFIGATCTEAPDEAWACELCAPSKRKMCSTWRGLRAHQHRTHGSHKSAN